MQSTAFDTLVDALTRSGRRVDGDGDSCKAQCPAHDDKTPSLSIRRADDRALITCHAGCTPKSIMDAVGLTIVDLFDREATYDYRDVQVHRKADKSFPQTGNTKSTRMFRQDELERHRDKPVLLVEGEKDANTVLYHFPDYVGVSFRQGASVDPARYQVDKLKGRDVTIVADNDDAGRKFAAKVGDLLQNVAKSVRVVRAAEGKDLTDHFQHGHGIDELVEMCGPTQRRSLVVTFGNQIDMKPIEWMMDDWLPWGFLTLLAGREGLGKSTIACKIAAERTLHGERVIYLATEDSIEHVVAPRLKAAGADMSRVMFLSVKSEFSDNGVVEFPADLDAVEDLIVDYQVRLVVLDAATSVVSQSVAGDGNNDRKIRAVLEPMAQLASRQNIVMLGLCHFGKKDSADSGKLMMGSIAWSQVARSVLSVAADEDSGRLVVTNTKSNLAKRKRSESVEVVTRDLGDGIDVGVAEWRGETDTTATDLLGDSGEREERTEAMRWVHDYLGLNPDSLSLDVKREGAKELGCSQKAIQRAAKKLGVTATDTNDFPRRTVWNLPDSGDSNSMRVPTVPTVPTGDDLHKHDVPTGSQSGLGVPTAARSGHSIPPGHAQSGQSGQSGHDWDHKCLACSEDLIFADDIADGFHTADRHCVEAAKSLAPTNGIAS
ncbi:AAA family ATPase [Gordonia humi]|uniref:Archaellum biogenesis ATPase FlaH/5S rRNA maturation endonuclease (Ribonuclease M5) n=1 Tax=Gordonia humi TaxID=686429 RepID=A0A840F528_9ACTN|nr:AAA family ATPase [Gordonia humi]MBB4134647.1 archaellum biogenesis ATPase FlaH/5S rRNA maturation endonuclease (ribonuclease M5) [Gordonia humi]